ncbi:MAG: RdgB/HAM1 family non-canonical purine NTP pyrophosphatase [Candidatus Omnitrophota bacterium]
MDRKLVIATRNKKKLSEIKYLLRGLDVEILSLVDFPAVPRINEIGDSFKENAIIKAVKAARHIEILALGEDSGLEVDALDGAPGIRSSRFSGWPKSDEKNNKKLLRLLKGVPLSRRTAAYKCAIAIADARGLVRVVEASCPGIIGLHPQGSAGFGYDPLFIIPKYKKTFAELGEGIKHQISHRARAVRRIERIIRASL